MSMAGRVLIFEDEAITAMAIAMDLESAGHTVCEQLAAGEQAVDAVERCFPDLILMDVRLAGSMNGIEAARLIRERFQVPLIFMTGYDDKKLRENIAALTPLAPLRKPIHPADLMRAIDQGLAGRL